MNANYPIKYAVLELRDENNATFGFIASKSYVIENSVRYLPDGSNIEYHYVVFPYSNVVDYIKKIYYDYHTQDIGYRTIPEYDLYGNIYSISVVMKLFNNNKNTKSKDNIHKKKLLKKEI